MTPLKRHCGPPRSRRILGQIRRLTFVAVCAVLAAALLTDIVIVPPLAGLAAIQFGMILLIVAPAWRQTLEAAGLGAVLTALAPLPPELVPSAWLILSALCHRLLYGRWLDHPALRLGVESRRQIALAEAPQHAWRHIVPGASHPCDHWSGTLVDFVADVDDPETLYLRFATADGLFEEATVTFLERRKPARCRYILERATEGMAEPPGSQVEVTIDITPGTEGSTVVTLMRQDDLAPGVALARWFDEADDQTANVTSMVTARHRVRIPALAAALARLRQLRRITPG